MRLEFSLRHVEWRSPLRAAHGGRAEPRPLILVRLEDDDGACGYGEAAPLQEYDGVGSAHVLHALGLYQLVIAAQPVDDHASVLRACLAAARLPQAIAAVDMALWDMQGRRAGTPIWQLLGASTPAALAVNATIGAEDPLIAGVEAAAAAADGYTTVKVKVGVGDDAGRLAAVRAAVGPHVEVRVDANGAWNVPEAIDALAALAEFDLELCEEPVHGIDGLSAVAEALPHTPVIADESAADPHFYASRVCAGAALKLARCGGITGLMREVQYGGELGYSIYLASTLDGPLGIAAALHCAAAIPMAGAAGLATLSRFDAPDVLPIEDGTMTVPDGPGLGDGLLEWY